MKVTLFNDITKVSEVEYIDFGEALRRIRDGESKTYINMIRMNLNDKDMVDKTKRKLPAIVWAGVADKPVHVKKGDREYDSYRTDKSIGQHSGLFVLDIDDVSDHNLIVEMLDSNPYVCAHWQSPSGYPKRKALVRCEPSIEKHSDMYQAFIDEHPQLKLDTTSRNIGRLCFESYDPDIIIKPWKEVKVWDKLPPEEVQIEEIKDKNHKKLKSDSKLAIAAWMIRGAVDGEKHNTLVKAAYLMGGYANGGFVDWDEAEQLLIDEISKRNPRDLELAKQTIKDGMEAGAKMPIHEVRKIERDQVYYEKEDGDYSFLADMKSIGRELEARRTGNIVMGRSTGIRPLDSFFKHKRRAFNIILGFDNVGKSTVAWYLAVLDALENNARWLIYSSENDDADIVDDMISFYVGKKIEYMSELELKDAFTWFNRHFKVISGEKGVYSHEEMLSFASAEYEKSGPYDVVLIEPWNGMIRKGDSLKMNPYEYSLYSLAQYNLFKKQYCSVYVCMHAVTEAARKNSRRKEGEARYRPWKFDADGGQIIANRCDDFMVVDRDVSDPVNFMDTNIYLDKIKRVKTGGKVTFEDQPVTIRFKRAGDQGNFGFTDSLAIDNIQRLRDVDNQEEIEFKSKSLDKSIDELYDDDLDLPF